LAGELLKMKQSNFYRFLSCLLFAIPLQGFCVECGKSLFITQDTAPNVMSAKERFDRLVRSFKPDANVDTIFEVLIEDKSVEEIEKIVSEGKENYFSLKQQYHTYDDGFSQDYGSLDWEWKKTIKVTTHNPKGQAIVPYLQIFYEDKFGGVIRLKPNGNSDAPNHLTHLKHPHGTQYFKVDPNGDLSFDNEAFKVYAMQAFPKAPNQVRLPEGVKFGTPEAEEFLKNCWTFKTHVPLSE
jgi:hypothetical protein